MAKKIVEVQGMAAEDSTPEKPDSVMSMSDAIAESVGKLGPRIREGLIEARVEATLRQKVTALDQGFAKRARLLKELNKVRADITAYDVDGKEVRSEWSKEQLKKKREATEAIQKIEKCLRNALDNDDYTELFKQTDNAGPDNREAH